MAKRLSEINYHVPRSVDEALSLMSGEENARIVAGNTLLNELGKRNLLNEVSAFVDISGLPLNFIEQESETGTTRIGALATFTQLLNEILIEKPAGVQDAL
ncbi:MAG: FAD binding domain-containing protein, partial [Thaumarchaeota archaeon]|nr:FAD binding domain-containing protein [Nitrososphaerota archaeon]